MAAPAAGQGEAKQEKPDPPSPALLSLSRDLTKLKDKATSRVRIYVKDKVHLGVYLGNGMVATSHVGDLEPGVTGTMHCDAGSYRLLACGGERRLKLVSFFKLRDYAHLTAEPPKPRLSKTEWRDYFGDLVCIVGSRAARLALVEESISFRWNPRSKKPGPGPTGERGSPFTFAYGMTDDSSTSGASVLAVDGGLVGMLVRRSVEGMREHRGRGPKGGKPPAAAKKGPAKATTGKGPPRRREVTLVIDARWLAARADRQKNRPIEATPKASLGVTLRDVRRYAMHRHRRGRRGEGAAKEQLPAPGLLVRSVANGSPAARAGVRVRDLWVQLGGKPLESLAQLREQLGKLPAGAKITLRYRREGKLAELTIRPD